MGQSALVEDEIADGRRFVERFAADGNPVRAAFWGKTSDKGYWNLYLATDLYDREGLPDAIRAVYKALDKLGDSSISSSDISAISPQDRAAKAVLEVMARHPGRSGTRATNRALGAVDFDETYIYPAHTFTFERPDPMTPEDVGREIVRLMSRGPLAPQPSRVSLRDGTAFNGVPFTLHLGSGRSVVAGFIADGEVAPRVVRLDEIASIA